MNHRTREMFAEYPDVVDVEQLRKMLGGISRKLAYRLLASGELGVTLGALMPSQLQTFYQTILDDGNTTNTVIHYHAVLHRALKNAVKKDIIDRNPADRVDKPRKNRYQASHYTQEEMLRLFSAIEGDPLEPAIRIAAYYGLRPRYFWRTACR